MFLFFFVLLLQPVFERREDGKTGRREDRQVGRSCDEGAGARDKGLC